METDSPNYTAYGYNKEWNAAFVFETQVWGDCSGYFGKGQETKIGRGDFEIGQTNGTKLWNGGGCLAALLRAMSTLELSGTWKPTNRSGP